jgi:hypothetical protein
MQHQEKEAKEKDRLGELVDPRQANLYHIRQLLRHQRRMRKG